MRRAWKAEGIDCALVETVAGATIGLYAIETDARGERSFIYWRGAAPAPWRRRRWSTFRVSRLRFSLTKVALG